MKAFVHSNTSHSTIFMTTIPYPRCFQYTPNQD